jgi:hypothetical protein
MPYFGIPIRNGLPIGLGSVAGFGVQQFSPADLFSAGEQGAWYDPSDLTTLFDDSAGTTPVTAVEQFVGLMLDKSGRGNHATQTNSLKRPKLAARYNLLTYSEQFDNAAWVRTGIAAFGSGSVANTTATTDPLGGNTADFLLPFNAANRQRVNQGATVQTSTQMRMTCYIKPGGYSKVALRESNTSGYYVSFDLSSTASPTILASSNATGTVSHVGNGWFLCSMTTTIVGTNFGASVYVLSPTYTTGDPETPVWTPDQVSGIYVWGADLRPASQATGLIGPAYQRVVDAATYDAVGFLPYLEFNGLSWSMSTGSIDFTATDKMTVWAGVRKLSDAAVGAVTELSAALNDGCFSILAPRTAADNRSTWTSRGTASSNAITNNLPAPISFVITGIGDIAGDISSVRTDGVLRATNTADQGTGNYGNYPLFIGARNNASLFFQGWLTSLIVRGAQSTQGQIEATESWVNGKTGAF